VCSVDCKVDDDYSQVPGHPTEYYIDHCDTSDADSDMTSTTLAAECRHEEKDV